MIPKKNKQFAPNYAANKSRSLNVPPNEISNLTLISSSIMYFAQRFSSSPFLVLTLRLPFTYSSIFLSVTKKLNVKQYKFLHQTDVGSSGAQFLPSILYFCEVSHAPTDLAQGSGVHSVSQTTDDSPSAPHAASCVSKSRPKHRPRVRWSWVQMPALCMLERLLNQHTSCFFFFSL